MPTAPLYSRSVTTDRIRNDVKLLDVPPETRTALENILFPSRTPIEPREAEALMRSPRNTFEKIAPALARNAFADMKLMRQAAEKLEATATPEAARAKTFLKAALLSCEHLPSTVADKVAYGAALISRSDEEMLLALDETANRVKEREHRIAVIGALAHTRSEVAVRHYERIMSENEPGNVRLKIFVLNEAASLYAEKGNENARQLIDRARNDADPIVRKAADFVWRGLRGQITPKEAERLDNLTRILKRAEKETKGGDSHPAND